MKKRKKRWTNDLAVTLRYNGEIRKCFGSSFDHLKERIPMAIHRQWKLWTNMNIDSLVQISKNEWDGFTIDPHGRKILFTIVDRKDRIKEAARLLGQIGGQAGTGKKKVRGDSNYYRVLRMKGVSKKNHTKG